MAKQSKYSYDAVLKVEKMPYYWRIYPSLAKNKGILLEAFEDEKCRKPVMKRGSGYLIRITKKEFQSSKVTLWTS